MVDWLNIDHMDDGISVVTLNRGPVNALNPAFLTDIAKVLDALEANETVRAIVLASPFKVFSAGLDLKEAQGFDLKAQHAIVNGLNETFAKLYGLSKPTVVAANGAAIAGGLFFVLGADYRVADERAKFGLAEVRVGADFPVGPMEIARDTLGPVGLRRLMLSGNPVNAKDALALGIVDAIAHDSDVMEQALGVARDYAQIPPKTFAAVKQQIRGETLAKIASGTAAKEEAAWFNDETLAAMAKMIG